MRVFHKILMGAQLGKKNKKSLSWNSARYKRVKHIDTQNKKIKKN